MGKKDPLITYLKDFGYSVVRLPRTNVKPLQLITKKGNSYERLGDLTTVFEQGDTIPLPEVTADAQAAGINGRRSSNLNIGVGLNLLANIVSAMGGSPIGLDVAFKQARFAVFEFDEVLEDSTSVAGLDQFLADASINPFSKTLEQMLEADRVYVTTSIIKSRKFTLEARKSREVSIGVQIPVIKEIVGGNVRVSGDSDTTAKVSFEGEVPLVFGFQAVRLFYENGIYTSLDPDKAGDAALELVGVSEEAMPRERLMTESPFTPLL